MRASIPERDSLGFNRVFTAFGAFEFELFGPFHPLFERTEWRIHFFPALGAGWFLCLGVDRDYLTAVGAVHHGC